MTPTNFQSEVRITHITTATSILEIDGVSFLTDPVFGDAPVEYDVTELMPQGTEKTVLKFDEPPALGLHQLPVIDAVLLSHEDHIDNLDDAGRTLLNGRPVLTTPNGAKNLAPRPAVQALKPWETVTLHLHGIKWEITGVPCVHMPGGEVTGFILRNDKFGHSEEGLPNAIYFTGDTILLPDHFDIKHRFHVVVALMNLGDARFKIGGREEPLQITMGGKEAATLVRHLDAEYLVPIHFESWHHFTQHGEELKKTFEAEDIMDRVCWLKPGETKRIL